MGESKIPLFAYVDETGNTGHNIFDEKQPDFFTAALITRGNFDASHGARVAAIALALGQSSLHAKDLGMHRLESVSRDILELLVASKAMFFVSRVEKKYLLVTKCSTRSSIRAKMQPCPGTITMSGCSGSF